MLVLLWVAAGVAPLRDRAPRRQRGPGRSKKEDEQERSGHRKWRSQGESVGVGCSLLRRRAATATAVANFRLKSLTSLIGHTSSW